jgi:hypothetical protein
MIHSTCSSHLSLGSSYSLSVRFLLVVLCVWVLHSHRLRAAMVVFILLRVVVVASLFNSV